MVRTLTKVNSWINTQREKATRVTFQLIPRKIKNLKALDIAEPSGNSTCTIRGMVVGVSIGVYVSVMKYSREGEAVYFMLFLLNTL